MSDVKIDTLSLEINSNAKSATSGIDALSESLARLGAATKGGLGLTSVNKKIGGLSSAFAGLSGVNLSGWEKAVRLLTKLGEVKISSTIGKNLSSVGTAINSLSGTDYSVISGLVDGLSPLQETASAKGFTSSVNGLTKLPEIFDSLKGMDMDAFASKMREVASAMKPLADEMQKVANGFSAFPNKIQKLIKSNASLSVSNKSVGGSYIDLSSKFRTAYNSVKAVCAQISKATESSMKYVESVNLFNISLGKFAVKAKAYADTIEDAMGIDPAEWMESQGIFMTLATGFGVIEDRAYTMSKNLTQLGYDIASFYNTDVKDAMQKLQSGLAGELEPLRRIGWDLSQAKLEATALSLGIDKAVSSMTQAEKAELRYYAIMTQVNQVQGDMARTLDNPANQMRIFKAQVEMAARAIGNIFIPILNDVIPLLTAVIKVVREIASAIAGLVGYKMPEVDDLGNGAENVADAFDEATDSAKKFKNYTMGIDELNIINPSTQADDESGSAFDFELPEYDFLYGAISNRVDEIVKKIKEWLGVGGEIKSWVELMDTRFGTILVSAGSIGTSLLGWKISKAFSTTLSQFAEDVSILKKITGLTIGIAGITLEVIGAYSLGQGDVSLSSVLKTIIGSALGVAGSVLVFGTNPLGWTIGIGLALTAFVTSFTIGKWDKAVSDDIAKRFGDRLLTDLEIEEIVSELTTNDLSIKLNLIVDQDSTVKETKVQLENVVTELDSYNFRVKMGVAVDENEYKATIDDFVTSVNNYVTEKQVYATMAVSILLDNTSVGNRLTDFTNEFYNASKVELNRLGTDLKNVVSEGFTNGEWIPEKLEEAIKLQREIQKVYEYLSTVDFEAKIAALKLNAAETDLSVESFNSLLSEANLLIEENLGNLEDIRLENLKIAIMEFDQNILNGMTEEEATYIYNQTVSEIEKKFNEGKLELVASTYDFGMDVIKSKYSEEIEKTIPFLSQTTQELFSQGVTLAFPEEVYDDIDILCSNLHDAFLFGIQDLEISKAARANIDKLLKELEPSAETLDELAKEARAAGETVPASISEGLSDYNLLNAISGDMNAINYLMGEYLSTDETFLGLLLTSENAGLRVGKAISDGLLNNLTVVEDASAGTVTLMNDTIGEKVFEVTPTLVKNLSDMGVNLSEGLLDGAQRKLEEDKKSWLDWAWLPWNWFKSANEINSPSKLFESGGVFIAEGLFNGLDNSVTRSDYEGIFGRISDALEETKKGIKSIINGIIGFIETMANGVVRGINKVINCLNGFSIDVPEWVTALTGLTEFGFNIPTINEISIPRLADGGFPETGQMFIAREAGAEMVGSIGRRTAVANNDQIVSGIASGVAEANGEQTSLLREQNTLLRALLEKESGVYLDGKNITNSVEKYQRERGRVVITGGVL